MRKSIHILLLVLLVVLTGHITLAQDGTSSFNREEFPPVQIATEGDDCLVTIESTGLAFAGFSTLNVFQQTVTEQGGTGFIVRSDGYILTSPSVVEDSEILKVVHQGVEYDATVEVIDKYYNLALLRIDATGLPVVNWGDSEAMHRGDPVVVMGAPAGLEQTLTYGFLTNIRDFRIAGPRGYDGMLILNGFVIDAALHSGVETGPVYNRNSEMIAIVARKGGGGIENIGYCMPSNLVKIIVDQMINDGSVCHPWLGIFPYQLYSRQLALYMGIPINEIDPETAEEYDVVGVLVEVVADTSPAAESGIVRGDLILRADGILLRTIKDLEALILNKHCGDTVQLSIVRNYELLYVEITIGNKQEDYGNIYTAYNKASI